ncbi:MAG: serine/threonine protein kinase [Phycisphaerales bacterium]|nr:MAG: serine/threonine protein kinase [Phycisphaerales bacterium]
MGHGQGMALDEVERREQKRMSGQRHQRLKQIFHRLVDADPAEHARLLDEYCGDDASLRGEAEAMLAHHAGSTENLLSSLLADLAHEENALDPDAVATGLLGREINGYEIRREIGRGGMGVVFEAFHRPLQRTVALKILSRSLASPTTVKRFEFEAAVLAMLEHPGIARVYEVGVWEADAGPHPFFAMELIDGSPLHEYLAREQPELEDRLKLLIAVCDAVHHAHQRGVIHRDLKPANILIDAHGRPHLLDFGIARLIHRSDSDSEAMTLAGHLLGTLAYMSPEQLGGTEKDQPNVCTDVYALGVVAYELIAERPAFDCEKTSVFKAAQLIRNTEPSPPTFRDKPLPSDLVTIIRKAMAKEPNERYDSASALADDLRRFLGREPVAACPPSRWYQFRKFAQRHRAAVTSAVLVVVLLIGSLAGMSSLYLQTEQARQDALQARDAERQARTEEAEQRRLAELSRQEANAAAERAREAEEEARQRAADLEQVAQFQATQLTSIEAAYMGANARQSILDRRRHVLANVTDDEAKIERGLEELERALAGVNFTDVAIEILDETIFTHALRAIGEQFTDQPRIQVRLLNTLSETLIALGLNDKAREAQVEAYHLSIEALGEEHTDTLVAINGMAVLLMTEGKLDTAADYVDRALAGYRRVLGDDHPDTLSVIDNIGELLRRQGQHEEARVYLEEALEGRRRVLGEEDPATLQTYVRLATHLHESGESERARDLLAETVETMRRVLGDQHQNTLTAINRLGMIYRDLGEFAQAESQLLEALRASEQRRGDDHPQTINAVLNLASLYRQTNRPREAKSLYRRALETNRRTLGETHPSTLLAMNSMGILLGQIGDLAGSEEMYRRVLEAHLRIDGPDDPRTLLMKNNLGANLSRQQRYDEAEPYLRRYLEFQRSRHAETHHLVIALNNFAGVLRSLGELEEADAHNTEAVEMGGRVLPERHWHIGVLKLDHARTLDAMKRYAEAIERTESAYEVILATFSPDHPRARDCKVHLVKLYESWHEQEPDRGYDQKATDWRDRLEQARAASGET